MNKPTQPDEPTPRDLDVTSALPPTADDIADTGINQPSSAVFGTPTPVRPADFDDVPTQLGRYALIGSPDDTSTKPYVEGGEGRIYLAQPIAGGPAVALKTPLPELARDKIHGQRLVREAEQLKSMTHSAIVEVIDIDDEHEPPYYTMTHLPGGSLAALIRERNNPLPLDEVTKLTVPLADAVRYVHDEKGVSHRDIKPLNVLLNTEGQPVFVDFGLSRDNTGDDATIADASAKQSQRFKVGTAMYMAPELLDGKAGNAQTDIYAFGVMLYELATGKRPYDAFDFPSLDKKKRIEEPLDPASAHPDIDPRLARVIRHALARRVRDRYASMEDLHEDLMAVRDGDDPIHAPMIIGDNSTRGMPVTPAPAATAAPTLAAPKPRRRALRLAATLAVLGSLAGGTAVLMNSGEEEASTPPPVPVVVSPEPPIVSPLKEGLDDPPTPVVITSTGAGTNQPAPPTGSKGINPPDQTPPPTPPKPVEPVVSPAAALNAEFSRTAPRDDVLADGLATLAANVDGNPDADVAEAYGVWLQRAAALGLQESLAVLILRAEDLGASPDTTLDNGRTWLQAAVRSGDNDAFAATFPQWMKDNDIAPAILTRTPIGTRTPLEMARFLGRETWVEALRKATGTTTQ